MGEVIPDELCLIARQRWRLVEERAIAGCQAPERAIHKGNPDTLTSRDYVYTEWDRVKHFAEEFLELCGTHTPAK
jgi:hypothetical protein